METLKDKCKKYQLSRDYNLDTNKYIIVHVDGRSFSKEVKKKFKRPFDDNFVAMMNKTAKYLCENVQGCQLAYVQSDEITLILKKSRPESDVFFNGRMCKMQSIIASMATAKFNRLALINKLKPLIYTESILDDVFYTISDVINIIGNNSLYQFDCKVWDVDNANDAFAWLLYRNIDCIRNSKNQTAQTYIPHNELVGKTADEAIAMLREKKAIDWNIFPDTLKYGRILRKKEVEIDGEGGKAIRAKWVVEPCNDLTNEGKRIKFIETNNFLKDNEYE